jgi:hypothetical protein
LCLFTGIFNDSVTFLIHNNNVVSHYENILSKRKQLMQSKAGIGIKGIDKWMTMMKNAKNSR